MAVRIRSSRPRNGSAAGWPADDQFWRRDGGDGPLRVGIRLDPLNHPRAASPAPKNVKLKTDPQEGADGRIPVGLGSARRGLLRPMKIVGLKADPQPLALPCGAGFSWTHYAMRITLAKLDRHIQTPSLRANSAGPHQAARGAVHAIRPLSPCLHALWPPP